MSENKPVDKIIVELRERAKELNSLYEIQEILNRTAIITDEGWQDIANAIPPGFQFPKVCVVKLTVIGTDYFSNRFKESPWVLKTDIMSQDTIVGSIEVFYLEELPTADEGPFLKEERRLIDNIAERIGFQILHQQLKSVFEEQKKTDQKEDWWAVLDMLKQTDPKLLVRLSRKMVNFLCWNGITEAEKLLEKFSPIVKSEGGKLMSEINSPYRNRPTANMFDLSYEIFEVAGRHLEERQILESIQKWTREDKSDFLTDVMEGSASSLSDINSALERYHHLRPNLELTEAREKSLKVALIRRILNDQSDFIDIAKEVVSVDSFTSLLHNVIYPVHSHGQLGGKSAGLFLAKEILSSLSEKNKSFKNVKTPKSWYITSDGLLNFMTYNNLEEIVEQKYKEIGRVRQEYPYVLQVFKNSTLPPAIVKGLLMALEDFGEVPLVIRSSSLLEDRVGSVFAGKYKSLFISNTGTKEKRLEELMDAIAEVYASTFGPDPILYRSQNKLLDYREEMGIMIQEVIGTRVGPYYFPAFAGVAFSRNEFRWSPRLTAEDGLVRLVPGLGTRAVDRLSNDYPILLSPGKPGLKVNVSIDETIKYSPKYIDVINLEEGAFETLDIESLLRRYGKDYPSISRVISVIKEDHIQPVRPFGVNFSTNSFVVNFEGLMKRTEFLNEIKEILNVLESTYNNPVDIEFAHDGKNFYLLQCRSQSYNLLSEPAKIPVNIDKDMILFSASKYISNGTVEGIKYIVYVDPDRYAEVEDHDTLLKIGSTVGKLNDILQEKEFILLGPGRWGSRGDIKLGVSVTYSEINNTAMLIEIAKKKKGYVPDVSFGTHFFQDLVEANIKYLPLFPDDDGVIFKDDYLYSMSNQLVDLLPGSEELESVIRVVNVAEKDNSILKFYMNSDSDIALGIIEKD